MPFRPCFMPVAPMVFSSSEDSSSAVAWSRSRDPYPPCRLPVRASENARAVATSRVCASAESVTLQPVLPESAEPVPLLTLSLRGLILVGLGPARYRLASFPGLRHAADPPKRVIAMSALQSVREPSRSAASFEVTFPPWGFGPCPQPVRRPTEAWDPVLGNAH
jgi:hypothetical protein